MDIAFLGPKGTFSHEFARSVWPNENLCHYKPLPSVIKAVADGNCDRAAAPFFNDNTRAIGVVQNAMLSCQGRIFVHELTAHDVKHHLYSYGKLSEISEIRSIAAVFPQVSNWMKKWKPDADQVARDSTAEAVAEIDAARDVSLAAIGSKIASEYYKSVPIVAHEIQNVPNQTIFASLCNSPPNPNHCDFLLFSARGITMEHAFKVADLVAEAGFRIGFPLVLENEEITILDIDTQRKRPSMRAADRGEFISRMHASGTPFRLLGGHNGQSLKSLIEQSKKPPA